MINWGLVRTEYDRLGHELANPALDSKLRVDSQKKHSRIGELLEIYNKIESFEKGIKENKALIETEAGEFKQLAQEELEAQEVGKAEAVAELEDMLYPTDPRDERSVYIEIRPAAGGAEAALFAAELAKMYQMYANAKRWEFSIVDAQATELGGYKEMTIHVKGKRAYKFLKFESGVHRVQRVPATETQGRVHTSTVTVAILPEVDDVDIVINPADLRIDTYRSSGAGGQHVNTTDSAIRIIHIPTGLMVTCQDERSQGKNKISAMKVLKARLFELERSRKEEALSIERKSQIGTGDRAEKIRTYNFPQNRVTDHRTELSLKKLDMVMLGDLDDIIKPLHEWEMNERRAKGSDILSFAVNK